MSKEMPKWLVDKRDELFPSAEPHELQTLHEYNTRKTEVGDKRTGFNAAWELFGAPMLEGLEFYADPENYAGILTYSEVPLIAREIIAQIKGVSDKPG